MIGAIAAGFAVTVGLLVVLAFLRVVSIRWVLGFLILTGAAFLVGALLVMWVTWALYDVGYVDHALDWSDSTTLALPLFVVAWLYGLGASRS